MLNRNQFYKEMEISTEIESASPHRQIQMLLDKCLQQLKLAVTAIADKNAVVKCASITCAIDILLYLKNCLNLELAETKELAANLYNVYEYSEKRLVQANIKNSAEYVSEVEGLIGHIKKSWDEIA